MVVVGMNLSHKKLLGEAFVYRLEVLLSYQRILNPRGIQTLEGERNLKKIKKSMKVEEGGVHRKRYDGHCTK